MKSTMWPRLIPMMGLAVWLTTAMAAPAAAQVPDKFTNLKVLPKDIQKQELVTTMRSFSSALGVRCAYCHERPEGNPQAEFDWASDKKPEKETARGMFRMVQMLNNDQLPKIALHHPDRVEVECRTCHHGQARPRLIDNILTGSYQSGGMDSVAAAYDSLRKDNYGSDTYNFSEEMLPELGERLAGRDHPDVMLKFAELNLKWFPQSGYAYLMRAQARGRTGDMEGAQADAKKAVELDPSLKENATRLLEMLNRKGPGK